MARSACIVALLCGWTTGIGRARRALTDRQIDTGERSGADVPTERGAEIEGGICDLRGFHRERERPPRRERLQEGEGVGIGPLDADGVGGTTDEQPIGALAEIDALVASEVGLV